MLGYNYTLTNPYTGKSITIGELDDGSDSCTVGRGFCLQQYPTFSLDVRNDFIDKSGQHGSLDFFSFYGSRSIVFQGLIMGTNHADLVQFQNRLREVITLPAQPLVDGADGFIEISWTDALGIEWKVDAKINQDLTFSRQLGVKTACSFFLSFRASNPYVLSVEEFEQSELRGWSQGLMILPTLISNNINIDWNRVINIYQAGTADSPGTYRVYGPAENPRIIKLVESFSNEENVSDFDSDEGWSGGTSDTVNYQSTEEARKLTSTNGAQAVMTLAGTWDLSDPEFVTFYFYVVGADNFEYGDYTEGENYVKFKTTDGVDEFVLEYYTGNGTIREGWNYFQALRDEFKQIGTPDWTSIVEVELSIKSKAATTLEVTFDELRVRDIAHETQTLELETTLSDSQYVDFDTLLGTITDQDGADFSSYLATDSEWFYITPRQNLIYMESDEANPLVTFEFPYTINDPVVEDDLIAYWAMEEDSGTTVGDIVGTADGTATASAAVNLGSGYNGSNCREFDGASGYVSIPDTLTTRNIFDGGGSVVAVINANSDGEGSEGRILEKGNGFAIYIADESAGFVRIYFQREFSGMDGRWRTTAVATPIGEETVIEICYDDGATTNDPVFYVNGTAVAITETSTPVGTAVSDVSNVLYIGNRAADDRTFDGTIDEVRFYEAIHTAEEAYTLGHNADQNKYKEQLTVSWRNSQL